MKKNKVSKTGIIVAVLLLAVGFAAVSTTLFINGVVNIGPNTKNFDKYVVFSNVSWDSTSAAAGSTVELQPVTIDGESINDKKISFTTHALKSIGETATLSYKITNGSQYTAKIGQITCTTTDADTTDSLDATRYVTVTAANGLKDVEVAPNNTTNNFDTITVEMVRSYAGDDEISVDVACTMNVTAVVQ